MVDLQSITQRALSWIKLNPYRKGFSLTAIKKAACNFAIGRLYGCNRRLCTQKEFDFLIKKMENLRNSS